MLTKVLQRHTYPCYPILVKNSHLYEPVFQLLPLPFASMYVSQHEFKTPHGVLYNGTLSCFTSLSRINLQSRIVAAAARLAGMQNERQPADFVTSNGIHPMTVR